MIPLDETQCVDFIAEGDKYITRGLIYLAGWFLTAPILLAAIGGVLLGLPGLGLGIAMAIGLGIWGYGAFLNWNYRKLVQRSARG